MKVGLDVSKMHSLSKARGIGYYAQNLYDSIKKFTNVEIELIEKPLNYNQFDLIHFPFFDLFKHTLPSKVSKPVVVTIHDLIPIQFSSHYPPGIKGRINLWRQKKSLRNASSIITVSETVKKDVEKILKLPPSKIHTIYSAASSNYKKITDRKLLEITKQKYNLPSEFILYIGNVNWNKNILNTAEAALKSGKPLVVVGDAFLSKNNLNHPEKKDHQLFIKKYESSPLIKLLGFVPDEDLVRLLNLATCLIFISRYEGFGLPILEAQSCGLPVITSKISATAEIAGNSAVLVNPDNPDEVAGSINSLFDSSNLRQKYIELGLKNVKLFSWEETAKNTVQVYNETLL